MNKTRQFLGLTSFEYVQTTSSQDVLCSIVFSNKLTDMVHVYFGNYKYKLTTQIVIIDSMSTCPLWTCPSTVPPKLEMHFMHCSIIYTSYWCTRDVFLLLNIILKINLNFELYGALSRYWIFMLFPSLWIFNNFNSINIFIFAALSLENILRMEFLGQGFLHILRLLVYIA